MEEKIMSRIGKYTDEKNVVLKKRDEILNGEPKKFIVKHTMLAPRSDPDDEIIDRIRNLHTKKAQETQVQKQVLEQGNSKNFKKNRKSRSQVSLKASPSFRAISRGTYYKINSIHDPPPP